MKKQYDFCKYCDNNPIKWTSAIVNTIASLLLNTIMMFVYLWVISGDAMTDFCWTGKWHRPTFCGKQSEEIVIQLLI